MKHSVEDTHDMNTYAFNFIAVSENWRELEGKAFEKT